MRSNAKVWVKDPDDVLNGDPPVQGEDAVVTTERTDENEVAIHTTVLGTDCALSTVYMTCAEAALLAAELTAVAVAGEDRNR